MARSTHQFAYEYEFDTFLREIKFAELTFERTTKEVEGGETEVIDVVKFNYHKEFGNFRDNLFRQVEDLKTGILKDLISQTSRFEKLVFISSIVAELESAINRLNINNGKLTHSDFSFSNISKGDGAEIAMTEDDIQNYYQVIKKYSSELLNHLKIIQLSVNNSTNDDFPILKPAPPNPDESSKHKPLAFFEHFFIARGFTRFHSNFFPSEEEDYYHISNIDKEKEIITYEDYDNETGEPYSYTREFKKVLLDRLYNEFLKTKKCIDARIDEFTSEAEIKLFLKVLVYRLKHIYTTLEKYEEALKYDTCAHSLRGLIRFVFDKYEPFVSEYSSVEFFKKIITPSKDNASIKEPPPITQKMLPQREAILAFKWVEKPQERTLKLHRALIDAGCIPNTVDAIMLSKAFHGDEIEHPLNIKWLKKVKGKLSKPLILFLFDQLMEHGLIEKISSNPDIYKKIQRVFTDHDGNPLQHFDVSSAQIEKRKSDYTGAEKEIMAIIVGLKS